MFVSVTAHPPRPALKTALSNFGTSHCVTFVQAAQRSRFKSSDKTQWLQVGQGLLQGYIKL